MYESEVKSRGKSTAEDSRMPGRSARVIPSVSSGPTSNPAESPVAELAPADVGN